MSTIKRLKRLKNLRLKESIFAGAIVAIPVLAAIFILRMLIGIFSFWEIVFNQFGIGSYYLPFYGIIITVFILYAIGRFIKSKVVDKVIRKLPLKRLRRYWVIVSAVIERFTSSAERHRYKIVEYTLHGKTSGGVYGILTGKTIKHNVLTETEYIKFVIAPLKPGLEPKTYTVQEMKNFDVIEGSAFNVFILAFTGGAIVPPRIDYRPWSKQDEGNVPLKDLPPDIQAQKDHLNDK